MMHPHPPLNDRDAPRLPTQDQSVEPSLREGSYADSIPAPDDRLGDRRIPGRPKGIRKLFSVLGPGLVTGASDDDPSGVGTYAATGAATGYGYLWTALITYPLMAAVQGMCARIGIVSGKGLAATIKQFYPKWLLYPVVLLLVGANTFNVGADLAAIAAGINLIVPIPIGWLIPPVALALAVVQVRAKYETINRVFKWLCLALLAYVFTAFVAHADWGAVARGTLIPHLPRSKDDVGLLIAILGTTISPYLFFWQAGQEVEEERERGEITEDNTDAAHRTVPASRQEVANAKLDVNLGMLASNLVMYFIILTTAATLHASGKTDITTANDAAAALRPLLGPASEYLFALGFIGAGLLAVPVLTGSAGYAVAETFGWREGLDQPVRRARGFYAVIVVSTLVGMLANFLGLDPIRALVISAVINGVTAPPLLLLIVLLANRRAVMGRFTNGVWSNVFGWAAFLLMTIATVAYVITLVLP